MAIEDSRESLGLTVTEGAARGWKGFYARHRANFRGGLTFVWLILLWEVVARFVVRDDRIFAPFSSVVGMLVSLFLSGEIWHHLAVSGLEFATGFLLAAFAGVIIGFLMGTVRICREYMDAWMNALYSAPLVALAPFYIMVFGVGMAAKAALVFTVVFFPVAVNTFAGVYATDPALIEVARSFNASRMQIFFKILVPFSLSYVVTGLRLGVGRGLTGVVVGEFFFASAGLGYLVALAGQTFNTPLLFAGVLVFAASGVAITAGLKRIEAKLAPWRHVEQE